MRINQVIALDSPRKLPQLRCAFRKHSCVNVSAKSTSRVEARRKRKICGRCFSTTRANSCAVAASAVVMAIASSAVPAAITQVDARTESEFTTPLTILIDSSIAGRKPAQMLARGFILEIPRMNGKY
jgi:hypothetical protein